MARSAWILILSLFIFSWSNLSQAKEKSSRFKEGDRLYRSKCTSCHRLLPPEDYPMEQWQEYVEKYGKKIKEEEKNKILEYLENEINARPR